MGLADGAPLQTCRNCGGGAPTNVHFCPQCSQLLSLGRQGDYFAFLGLPRKLTIEPADLERRFRTLSRQFHPDYFQNASPAERRASLERSSYLNDAYRTLRTPASRIEYLLGLEGLAAKPEDGMLSLPAGLLQEAFELNEELDDIRTLRASGAPAEGWKARLDNARVGVERWRDQHEAQLAALSTRWDALTDAGASNTERRVVLEALRGRSLERNYISNLLAGIDRELVEDTTEASRV
jgi:molecular chaperone HscB